MEESSNNVGGGGATTTTATTTNAREDLLPSSLSTSSQLPQQQQQQQHQQQQTEQDVLMMPLIMANEDSLVESSNNSNNNDANGNDGGGGGGIIRRSRNPRRKSKSSNQRKTKKSIGVRWCPHSMMRSRWSVMNFLARLLFWSSVVALVAAVFWYSYELKNNGTDPHLIAWFSAGAFVLLGFPISMYAIVMHLANYNQPNVQCYIVRILWMVPIYSMESWLCLRFHRYAIYIETLRDCYESYVLYSFLQFLIQVLGGEEDLVLMFKDKSPTRGVHMWGLQWCVRPWLMGQPVSRTVVTGPGTTVKRVQWTSPFFVRCKFGVLQYVLLKFISSIFVMILELNNLYHEGDFTIRGGYLYICILTNLSQCWALYCLIFFYFATHNELSPIRPVGKFLSVKALVFFTWWQSVCISMVYQLDMIPHYSTTGNEWTPEAIAKGLQDYLICIEMFVAALVHTFVFPHTDYLPAAVAARKHAHQHSTNKRRLGRKRYYANNRNSNWLYYGGDDKSACSKNSYDLEMASQQSNNNNNNDHADDHYSVPPTESDQTADIGTENTDGAPRDQDDDDEEDQEDDGEEEDQEDDGAPVVRTGFVKALFDSAIPRDVIDNSVGIVKGDYKVEKKSLLHHAATSDQYDLFSRASKTQ